MLKVGPTSLLLWVVCLFFAVARWVVPVVPLDTSVTGLFKDAAHVWVGVLAGLAWAWRGTDRGKYALIFLGALSVVEVVAFLVRK